MARPCKVSQRFFLVDYPQNTPARPCTVVLLTVPAGGNVTRRTPEMTDVLCPFPGLVVAPFADAEHDRVTGVAERVAHSRVSTDRTEAVAIAPVVFEIIDAPRGIRYG